MALVAFVVPVASRFVLLEPDDCDPQTFKSPHIVTSFPKKTSHATPNPPQTTNAPVVSLVEFVVDVRSNVHELILSINLI